MSHPLLEYDTPIDSVGKVDQLSMKSAETFMYLDSLLMDDKNLVMYSGLFRDGGQMTADQIWAALISNKSLNGHKLEMGHPRNRYTQRIDYYAPKTEVQVAFQSIKLEPKKGNDLLYSAQSVRMADDKTYEQVVIHHHCWRQTVEKMDEYARSQFYMICPHNWTQEQRDAYFFDHLRSRARTVPMLPIWTPALVSYMSKSGYIHQLQGFGRFHGWKVEINQHRLGEFIQRQLANRTLSLPEDLLLAA